VTLLLAVLIAAAIIAVRAATRPTAPCGCSSYPIPTTTPVAPTGPSRA
jgi:hypothetical protein